MKRILFSLLALAALIIPSQPAAAATFDSQTGTGYVSKAEVQRAFGLNNTQFQAIAAVLEFRLEEERLYDITCDRLSPPAQFTFHRSRLLSSYVSYETRGRNQVTGFNLVGFSGLQDSADTVTCLSGLSPDGDPVLTSYTAFLSVNGVPLLYLTN